MSMASDLATRLARNAEAVCRHYLPAGRREGRYWTVGDVLGSPGRSLHVRLVNTDRGLAGKWVDEATGEHGDLLDLIAANQSLTSLRATLDEARRFLSLPQPEQRPELRTPAPTGSPEAARRLWAISKSLAGTLADRYLTDRGITVARQNSLRFHPGCWYRPGPHDLPGTRARWPALIAAVTSNSGTITGIHRTWLDPAGGKAPIATPRRAMGHLLGQAVRFGEADDVIAVGEGVETMLSLRTLMPSLPTAACLSASNLAAFKWNDRIRRLYIAREADPAGKWATETLAARADAASIDAIPIDSISGDLNDDLRQLRHEAFLRAVLDQLHPPDVIRFAPVERPIGVREIA